LDRKQEANGFKIPISIVEPWQRLEDGGGTRSDLESVLTFLAKTWAFEPDRFDRWLGENYHVERKNLSSSKLAEYKLEYERQQAAKKVSTRDLIRRLSNGPHFLPLIEYTRAFSEELKAIVFKVALATPHNEDFVFVLSALSTERPHFVQEHTSGLPDSPILQTFVAYTKKTRLPLAFEGRSEPIRAAEGATPLDRLFGMATRPWESLLKDIHTLPDPERETLFGLAERLFKRLSETKVFEAFLKLNLAVFLVAAHSKSDLVPSAVQLLTSHAEPAMADVLVHLGKESLVSEIRDVRNLQRGRERFLAAVIDAYRRRFPESISDLKDDFTAVSAKKQPLLDVAVSAARLSAHPKDIGKFERLLLRRLRNDKEHQIREWIVRNPEFARYFRADMASLDALKAILDAYKAKEPKLALRIVEQILSESGGATRSRYWEEGLRLLAEIGGEESDYLFSKFITERLADVWDNQEIRQVLATRPARALLRRTFWSLLNTRDNEERLFDLYASQAPEPEVIGLMETAFLKAETSSSWIIGQLLPKFLEKQSISPMFFQYVQNRQFLAEATKGIARKVLNATDTIREVTNEWASKRNRVKRQLLSRIETGIRIAIQNSLSDSALRGEMVRLENTIEEWAGKDSPTLDTGISSYAATFVPTEHSPDREYLEHFFRERPRGPNDFALFAGVNPWVIDFVLSDENGPWPRSEVLLGQIAKTFLFVSQLQRRAESQTEAIEHIVRVELAAILREPLGDIEADLAGYFILRDILDESGLHPVMPRLGGRIEENELSSQSHKVIRDPSRRGLLRVFGLGIRVDDAVVSSGTIMKSGGEDDRD